MRLDKFLKVSGLSKRRTVAKKLCDADRVRIGGRIAKAATEVAAGDELEIRFGSKLVVVEVLSVAEQPVGRGERGDLYQVKKESPLA
jgi:ribosomal 50S subunit-recycling heat shock protein